jgi:hypothetical protein
MGTLKVSGNIEGSNSGSGVGYSRFDTDLNYASAFAAGTGLVERTYASPNAFVSLGAIGTGAEVESADFLFVKTTDAFTLEITYDDGVGGNVVVVQPMNRVLMITTPETRRIKLVRVKGTGTLTYFASKIAE